MQLKLRLFFAIILSVSLSLGVQAEPWDCVVISSEDDLNNETFQISIQCELPASAEPEEGEIYLERVTDTYSPSLNAEERILYEAGSSEDLDVMLAGFIEIMKEQYTERTTAIIIPAIRQETIISTAILRANIDKVAIQVKIDAMVDGLAKSNAQTHLDQLP
jgi:hypothetical protein